MFHDNLFKKRKNVFSRHLLVSRRQSNNEMCWSIKELWICQLKTSLSQVFIPWRTHSRFLYQWPDNSFHAMAATVGEGRCRSSACCRFSLFAGAPSGFECAVVDPCAKDHPVKALLDSGASVNLSCGHFWLLQWTQPEHKKNKQTEMKPEIVKPQVTALQDHCSHKAPTINHHINNNSASAGVSRLSTQSDMLIFTYCG